MQVDIREAKKEDLLHILELYKQPDMDNGEALSAEQAENILKEYHLIQTIKYLLQ